MDGTSPGRRLKDLIRSPELLTLHAVYDGYSVRLVEKFGYHAAFISGAAVSESNLGWPDVGLMGMEEKPDRMPAAGELLQPGFARRWRHRVRKCGKVYHMVQAFEQAGVAGIMIEDQQWPKRCGHMQGKSVVDAEEQVEKLKAAVAARRDSDFVLKARTDAYATHGIGEAIRRLNLYAEAGADLIFADALATEEDIRTVLKNVSAPLCVNMGFAIRKRSTTALISARRLQDMGVAVVMYGRMLGASAIQGLKNSLTAFEQSLKEDVVTERPDLLVSFEELNELMGLGEVKKLEQQFVRKGKG